MLKWDVEKKHLLWPFVAVQWDPVGEQKPPPHF